MALIALANWLAESNNIPDGSGRPFEQALRLSQGAPPGGERSAPVQRLGQSGAPIRVLNDQYTMQLVANERRFQMLPTICGSAIRNVLELLEPYINASALSICRSERDNSRPQYV